MSKQIQLFWVSISLIILIAIIAIFKINTNIPNITKSPTEPINIGVLLPLTGDGASYGIPLRRSAELAINEINQDGGIAGRQIVAIFEDGQCSAEKAITATQKLINLDHINIIMGGACLEETLPIAPLAETAKVLVISPAVTNPELTKAGDFIFRTIPADTNTALIAAEYAYNKMDVRKVAVLSEKKDYAQGLRQTFKDKFASLGGEILADETYLPEDTDLKVRLLKIKIQNPELIYLIPQTADSGLKILSQLRANDIPTKILTTDVLMNNEAVEKSPQDLEGIVGLEQFFDKNNTLSKNMLEKYATKFGEDAPLPIQQTNLYSQFYLIKSAIEKVGTNTEQLRDYLYSLKNWKHALGTLNFDTNGDPTGIPYLIKKVEDGKLIDVEVYKPMMR